MILPNFLSVETAATGSSWTPFPAYDCGALNVLNNSGQDIVLRRTGEETAGRELLLKTGQAWGIQGITNANQIQVRRDDEDNAQVTVHAEAA